MGNLMDELIAREKMKEYDRRAQEIWQSRKRKRKEPDVLKESGQRTGIFRKKGNGGTHDRGVVCSAFSGT